MARENRHIPETPPNEAGPIDNRSINEQLTPAPEMTEPTRRVAERPADARQGRKQCEIPQGER